MKIDEQEQKGYKIEIHNVTGEGFKGFPTIQERNETNDSTGTISDSSFSDNETSRKTKKFNWLFWRKS